MTTRGPLPLKQPGHRSAVELPKILLVDDEPALLDALHLQLRRHAVVVMSPGPREGLQAVADQGPFHVVISDMRMPGMDGVTFLARVREIDSQAIRMMLTGNADIETALAAVNEGHVFRLLTKPCPPHVLLANVEAAIEQHRLVNAERVLLTQTLAGCVRALTGMLGIARPRAMGRAMRVRQRVAALAEQRGEESWAAELAAMLSQVPTLTLTEDVERRHFLGQELSEAEQSRIDRIPATAADLIAGIPRLEEVREILLHVGNPSAPGAPWGAKALAVALDLDGLAQVKADTHTVLARLASRGHDPWLVEALADLWLQERDPAKPLPLAIAELKDGMRLAADVVATNGGILATGGHEITAGLLVHLQQVATELGVVEPVYVIAPSVAEQWQ